MLQTVDVGCRLSALRRRIDLAAMELLTSVADVLAGCIMIRLGNDDISRGETHSTSIGLSLVCRARLGILPVGSREGFYHMHSIDRKRVHTLRRHRSSFR